jgi:pyruvate dehydrogenase (quinone)
VPSVDYSAVAAALGLYARRVEDPADIEPGLQAVLGHPGPALLDVVTDPMALSLPPTITAGQVKGFALAMSKMVMGGGAGEAVKMAKSNLRNIPRPSQFG